MVMQAWVVLAWAFITFALHPSAAEWRLASELQRPLALTHTADTIPIQRATRSGRRTGPLTGPVLL